MPSSAKAREARLRPVLACGCVRAIGHRLGCPSAPYRPYQQERAPRSRRRDWDETAIGEYGGAYVDSLAAWAHRMDSEAPRRERAVEEDSQALHSAVLDPRYVLEWDEGEPSGTLRGTHLDRLHDERVATCPQGHAVIGMPGMATHCLTCARLNAEARAARQGRLPCGCLPGRPKDASCACVAAPVPEPRPKPKGGAPRRYTDEEREAVAKERSRRYARRRSDLKAFVDGIVAPPKRRRKMADIAVRMVGAVLAPAYRPCGCSPRGPHREGCPVRAEAEARLQTVAADLYSYEPRS